MKRFFRLVVVLVAVLTLGLGCKLSQAAGIQLLTEEYEPLALQNHTVTGLSVEVVREVLKYMHRTADIKVVNWADGYRMVLQGPDTALFSTVMTAERKGPHF